MASQPVSADVDFIMEDVNLEEYWRKTMERCSAVAGWKLEDNAEELSLATIQAKLQPKKPKTKKQEIADKAANAFFSTLTFVQRFASIISSAASTVFSPASQCSNAISFVLDAIKDYHTVIAEIATLMEELSAFLERIDAIIGDGLDKRLRTTLYRVLDHFLYIMSVVYQIRGNWQNKVFQGVRTLFIGKNPVISDATARLKVLTARHGERQLDVVVTDTRTANTKLDILADFGEQTNTKLDTLADYGEQAIEYHKDTQSRLSHIGETVDRSAVSAELDKRRKVIADVLCIYPAMRTWISRYDELCTKQAIGTGNWLREHPAFMNWADFSKPSHRILAFKAPAGHGKSVLASAVVKSLQAEFEAQSRVQVVHYWFKRDAQDPYPVNRAIRSLVYQLAYANSTLGKKYAEIVERQCKRVDVGKTAELWDKLVLDVGKADQESLTGQLYVVLDGLEEINTAELKILADVLQTTTAQGDKSSGLQVRILLTGREDIIGLLDTPMPQIRLGVSSVPKSYYNKSDILGYTEQRFGHIKSYQDGSQVAQLLHDEQDQLAENVLGDYGKLNLILKKVEEASTIPAIKAALAESALTSRSIMRNQITALNKNLTSDEIAEINEMLIWATHAVPQLSIDDYWAILNLRSRRNVLTSLKKQIQDKYTIFDVSDSQSVTLRFEDYFSPDMDHAESSEFQHGEVALVERMVKTHLTNIYGDDQLYIRFGFADFFKSKISAESSGIHVAKNAHEHIAHACSIALMNRTTGLERYAFLAMLHHLPFVKVDDVDLTIRNDIFRSLNLILADADAIENWWLESKDIRTAGLWILIKNSQQLESLAEWADSAQEEGSLTLEVRNGRPAKFLINIAKHLAGCWFHQGDGWQQAYYWLLNYMSKMRPESENFWGLPKGTQLKILATWTSKNLNCSQHGQWHVCLANSALDDDLWDIAADRFALAVADKPDDWKLAMGLSEVFGYMERWDKAAACLEQYTAIKNPSQELQTALYEDVLPRIGTCHLRAHNFEAAVTVLRRTFQYVREEQMESYALPHLVLRLTHALYKQQAYAEIMQDLEILTDSEHIFTILHSLDSAPNFHEWIIGAARRTDTFEQLSETYKQAIEIADTETAMHLRHFFALHSWADSAPHDRAKIIALWEQNLDTNTRFESKDMAEVVAETAKALATAYIDIARECDLRPPLSNDVKAIIDKLWSLHNWNVKMNGDDAEDVRLSLARLCHLTGDEEKAKDCVRPYLQKQFELMSKTTAFDTALWPVAWVMGVIDDNVNAIIAWRLGGMPSTEADDVDDDVSSGEFDDLLRSSTLEEKDMSQSDTVEILRECNGGCEKDWKFIGDDRIYVCKDCSDIQFEAGCYEKLQSGTLDQRRGCSKNHQHLEIPPLGKEEYDELAKGIVRVGSARLTKTQWLKRLKETWQLDDETLARQKFEKQKQAVAKVWRAGSK